MTDLAGGVNADDFGSVSNLALGGFVLVTIILLNRSANPWVRLSSIVLGLIAGYAIAAVMGQISFAHLSGVSLLTIPIPFQYGFAFDFSAFFPVALIYLVTAIETSGDITANCIISKQPIKGEEYIQRIRGGVLADGSTL
jgi:xanthine permease XanP